MRDFIGGIIIVILAISFLIKGMDALQNSSSSKSGQKTASNGNRSTQLDDDFCFEDELEMAGLDRFDLEMMDEDERNATMEDAGLDPFDWEEVQRTGVKWVAEDLAGGECAGVCEGNLPDLLFVKKSPVRRPGSEMNFYE